MGTLADGHARMTSWQSQTDAVVAPAVARSDTIREIVTAPGALDDVAAFYRRNHGDHKAIVIADDNTHAAAGEKVVDRLAAAGIAVTSHVLAGRPRPKSNVAGAEEIMTVIADAGAIPVAVGSGVVNDLVKYAAFQLGRDYSCIATAASMDGYASAGAPLTQDGFKKTIACRPPVAIVADLTVLAAAPPEMAGWGFGDLAGKVPAGADWLLADALGIETIDDVAWPLVQGNLRQWLADPDGVAAGDPHAIAALFVGLTVSGLAMEFYGSSRPASGADHQIAHMWEMEGLTHNGERVSHGACVSIGTLTALHLYDWIIERDFTEADVAVAVRRARTLAEKHAQIIAHIGNSEIAEHALAETTAKHVEGEELYDRLHKWVSIWPDLRPRLKAHLLRHDEMADLLGRANAPLRAREIGVSPDHHRQTVLAARFIRSRYSVLDTLDDFGLLEVAIDNVLAGANT